VTRRLAENHTHPEAERWPDKVRAQRVEARKPTVAVYGLLKRDGRFDRRVTELLRRVLAFRCVGLIGRFLRENPPLRNEAMRTCWFVSFGVSFVSYLVLMKAFAARAAAA